MTKKRLYKYTKTLFKRVYRLVKPFVNPLVKRIRLWQVLGVLVGLGILGSLVNGFIVKPQERASFWPWSSKSHSEMAIYWFEAGDEKKALAELEMANKLLLVKNFGIEKSVRKAEEKVREPERIREEIKSWEKVLEKKPYYRDVLLRLAILKYQIYEDDRAIEYFEQALYLDPNNEQVKQVKEIIF